MGLYFGVLGELHGSIQSVSSFGVPYPTSFSFIIFFSPLSSLPLVWPGHRRHLGEAGVF